MLRRGASVHRRYRSGLVTGFPARDWAGPVIGGGWDSRFSSPGAATVLDALSSGRVLGVQLSGGKLLLSRLELRGGSSVAQAPTWLPRLSGRASAMIGQLNLLADQALRPDPLYEHGFESAARVAR